MRVLLTIVLIIALISVIGYAFYYSDGNKKSPASPDYSQTKNDSKDARLFRFDLKLVSNKEIDRGANIEIEDAWVESAWSRQILVFGGARKITSDDFQIVVKFKIQLDSSNQYYYFLGKEKYPNTIVLYCDRLDTIKVPLYRQAFPGLVKKKYRKAFDSLSFVKQ